MTISASRDMVAPCRTAKSDQADIQGRERDRAVLHVQRQILADFVQSLVCYAYYTKS